MRSVMMMHEPTREYAYPVARDRLVLRLKCLRDDAGSFFAYYCNRFHDAEFTRLQMDCTGRDGEYSYYSCEIATGEAVKYIRYYFERAGEEGSVCFGVNGMESLRPSQCFEYLYTNECDVFAVPEWAAGAVFYQVFPERFCNGDPTNDPDNTQPWGGSPTRDNFFGGDLKGILSRLDYIAGLGADVIYLNPVFKSPSNHKYDTEDYYAIDPSFGTMEDMKELVQGCHSRGLRVVLDGVFNHCGYMFPPFQDVLKNGAMSAYADWFFIDSFPVRTDPLNYECVGYYKWMPKLRLKNRAVREYFINVGTWWIRETGVDGWRLDVADEVDFTFWQEFRRAVKSVREDAILIGETWKDGRNLLCGDQMDSVMNYLFRDAAVAFFAQNGISAEQFDNRIQRMLSLYPRMVYPVLYNLIGSHDTPRFLTLCGGDPDRMRLAVAFQMAFPGAPAVYYGDELAMAGENDPDCRHTMDWERGDRYMLAFYRQLISLRRENPALRHGGFQSVVCQDGVYGFARTLEGETVYVLLNNSGEERRFSVPLLGRGPLKSLMDGHIYAPDEADGAERFFHSDSNRYVAKIGMALPARRFDIIKQGGMKG